MLTRFVRIQLAIFTIVGTIGVIAMVLFYIQAPTLLGIGRMTVTLELPATGGLYRFSNVTYRGVQIGKVTAVGLTPTGAKATLSLSTSPKIPADLKAEVRSVSAVGEQYVDLRPRTDSPPYLRDGSVIAMRDTTIPQAVGPMLDQVSALGRQHPEDTSSANCSTSRSRASTVPVTTWGHCRFLREFPRLQRRRRSHPNPDRGHRAATGFASTDHRFDQDVGA